MANNPFIYLYDGTLREGETIELMVDHSGDLLFHLHPHKTWTVFAEKDIKYSTVEETYYYDENKGTVYTATDADNIQIPNIIPGRLFALFQYTDYYGNFHELKKVFQVLPTSYLTISSDIIINDTKTFTANSTLNDFTTIWTFSDNGQVISGNSIDRECEIDGYHTIDALINYSAATYSDNTSIIWASLSGDVLANISLGEFGNETPINPGTTWGESLVHQISSATVSEHISGSFLTKYDLNDSISLSVSMGNSSDQKREAPMYGYFSDNSTYNLDVATSGANRIEYVEVNFGDGEILRKQELNFSYQKLYKRSSQTTFNGTFTVYTAHTRSGGDDYRQTLSTTFSIDIEAFFAKWIKQHFQSSLYNSDGFYDLCNAWGLQMDRLYNEIQILMDSIDVEKIDNKFISGYAATYGDFPEIYKKVGFTTFTKTISGDRFSYLEDYNFFDRILSGNLLNIEKQEFINYIQTTRTRLQSKGTPQSIEQAIAQFALSAYVKELWTNSFDSIKGTIIRDEVFGGDAIVPHTGIRHQSVSTPLSDNLTKTIINSENNSYLEIDTAHLNNLQYFTSDTEKIVVNNIQYAIFDR